MCISFLKNHTKQSVQSTNQPSLCKLICSEIHLKDMCNFLMTFIIEKMPQKLSF